MTQLMSQWSQKAHDFRFESIERGAGSGSFLIQGPENGEELDSDRSDSRLKFISLLAKDIKYMSNETIDTTRGMYSNTVDESNE